MDGGYVQVSNLELPAGYTYFAQFVFHDLTAGVAPRLELRSLYGAGPTRMPRLYDQERPGALRTGRPLGRGTARDLPRDTRGRPVIADWRNDRTIMLGQIHPAFIDLHNAILRRVSPPDSATAFAAARRRVLEQYRWLVLHDLLPRLVDQDAMDWASSEASKAAPLERVPVEFSLGAGRAGHAMVKPRYRLNDQFQSVLFADDGASRPLSDLRGQRLTDDAVIDWSHFFPVGSMVPLQRAAKFNPQICRPLFKLPGPRTAQQRSIAYLTLAAGERAHLPSGQAVACSLGCVPLASESVWNGLPFGDAEAPLWYYLLREAECQQHGGRLGEVGGRIVARTLLGSVTESQWRKTSNVSALGASTVGGLLAALQRLTTRCDS
jgi:hypothetical protein